MNPLIARRVITNRRSRPVVLSATPRNHLHLCSKSIPIISNSYQFDKDPMILIHRLIYHHLWMAIQNGNDRINSAVVIKITECCSTVSCSNPKTCSCLRAHIFEYQIPEVMQNPVRHSVRPMFYRHSIIENRRVGGENVLFPIIVEVIDTGPPSSRTTCLIRQTRLRRDILELSAPQICIEWKTISEHGGMKDVRAPVII